MVMQNYGKVYVLKKNVMEHQTMCGEIQEKKKDLTGKKKKFSSFLWKNMVIFSLFKQYFSEDDEPVCIPLCIKCVSICLR